MFLPMKSVVFLQKKKIQIQSLHHLCHPVLGPQVWAQGQGHLPPAAGSAAQTAAAQYVSKSADINNLKQHSIFPQTLLIAVFVFQQKIQSELTSHEISLEEMKKRNRGKDAAKRVLSQIDVAQVGKSCFHHFFLRLSKSVVQIMNGTITLPWSVPKVSLLL